MLANIKNKILIFSTAYFPFIGGAEVAVKEITDKISDDFYFDMITARMDKKLKKYEKIGNVNVYRIGWGIPVLDKLFLAFFGWRMAKKLNKKNNYIFSWAIMASFAGLSALLFKKKCGVPLFLTLQEGDNLDYIKKKSSLIRKSFLNIFKKADFIQAISSFLKDWAISNGAQSDIFIIPNGVAIDKFKQLDGFNRDQFRSEMSFNNNDKIIITTSRLVKKNGIADLIKSLLYLPAEYKLLILGDGQEKNNLINLSKKINLNNRVYFLGIISHDQLPKYLWSSDVFCRPSLSEGLGNSFLEAMMAGLPTIATKVGGIPDFLKDEENGWFCEVENPKNIAEKIEQVFKNKELREKIIEKAIKTVENNYSWNLVADKMSNIFNKINIRARNKKLNILIATGIFPPDIGGPATYSSNLRLELINKGHNIEVLFYKIEKKLPIFVRHLLFFIRICFKVGKIDFVLAMDTFSAGLPSFLAAKLFNKKFIIRTGGDFLWESYIERTGEEIVFSKFYKNNNKFNFKEKIIFKLTKFLLKNSSAIIFSTNYQKDIFKDAYGLDEKKCFIVENFYNNYIGKLNNINGKRFIWAGRNIKLKNIKRLKEAFKLAKIERSDIELELYSGVGYNDLMDKIKNCYAVILPSISEISPNFILEAISFKKPFISTKENGLINRIKNLGIFFDPLNANDLKEKILYLANDENYKKIENELSNFDFEHNYEEIADEIINIYLKL